LIFLLATRRQKILASKRRFFSLHTFFPAKIAPKFKISLTHTTKRSQKVNKKKCKNSCSGFISTFHPAKPKELAPNSRWIRSNRKQLSPLATSAPQSFLFFLHLFMFSFAARGFCLFLIFLLAQSALTLLASSSGRKIFFL
jgi:hypothetical protein